MKFKALIRGFLILSFVFGQDLMARTAFSGHRFEHLSGIRKSHPRVNTQNLSNENLTDRANTSVSRSLLTYYDFIPSEAHVYELGVGEGHNSVFLARKGYQVTIVDDRSKSIGRIQEMAREYRTRVQVINQNHHSFNPDDESLDALLIFYLIDNELFRKAKRWVRPGGVIYVEVHNKKQRNITGFQEHDEKFFIERGELLDTFSDMKILLYKEPLHYNDYLTTIIAKRPKNQSSQQGDR